MAPILAAGAQVIGDVASRVLSRREAERVNSIIARVKERIKERRNAGALLRDDGFFVPNQDGRTDGAEVFESVFLKAQREVEERKLRYLANVLANAAFSRYSAEDLHVVIRVAERMTYRQFKLLALAKRAAELGVDTMRFIAVRHRANEEQEFVAREWSELRSPSIAVLVPEAPIEGTSIGLTRTGQITFELLGLAEIPTPELAELATLIAPS